MAFTDTPRIYVACLAAYNNGHLHGAWINATSDIDEMQDAINAMLKASPIEDAEEWAIHDHEGLGDIGEYTSLAEVAKRYELIEFADAERICAGALFEYADQYHQHDDSADDIRRGWDNVYITHCVSFREYADEVADELIACAEQSGGVNETIARYFDYESFARDLQHDYNVIEGDDNMEYVLHA